MPSATPRMMASNENKVAMRRRSKEPRKTGVSTLDNHPGEIDSTNAGETTNNFARPGCSQRILVINTGVGDAYGHFTGIQSARC